MSPLITTAPAQLGVGDAAPDMTLPDSRGRDVPLSDLWHASPLVLLFIRHFG